MSRNWYAIDSREFDRNGKQIDLEREAKRLEYMQSLTVHQLNRAYRKMRSKLEKKMGEIDWPKIKRELPSWHEALMILSQLMSTARKSVYRKTDKLDGAYIHYASDTVFAVESGKGKDSYKGRYNITGNLSQAVLYYRSINIGPGYKKRLRRLDSGKVLSRYIY